MEVLMKCITFFFGMLLTTPLLAQGIKPLTVEDIMRFRKITDPVIEAKGSWIGYISKPDRGDWDAVLRATAAATTYKVPNGTKIALARGGEWAAVEIGPDALFREKTDKKKLKAHKNGLALVNLADGSQESWEKVQQYAFSDDGAWVAVLLAPPKEEGAEKKKAEKDKEKPEKGGALLLRKLASGHEIEVSDVTRFAFSGKGGYIAYARSTEDGNNNGLYYRHLAGDHSSQLTFAESSGATFPQIAWDQQDRFCAWLEGTFSSDDAKERREHQLRIWEAKSGQTRQAGLPPAGQHIPHFQKLRWSKDSERLFYGTRDMPPAKDDKQDLESLTQDDLYNVEGLLKRKGLDVWHGNDPLIKTNARKAWNKFGSKHTYATVWWPSSKKTVQLADPTLPHIYLDEQSNYLLAASDVPYKREVTWAGHYADFYVVNLKTGKRALIAERLSFNRPDNEDEDFELRNISLSAAGGYVAYYKNGDVHLHQIRNGKARNLTSGLGVSFANEDHDYPRDAPGYGFGGWVAGDAAVLVYDKFDIWSLPTAKGKANMLTGGDGRERKVQYRIEELDKDHVAYQPGQKVLLKAYFDQEKHHGFYRSEIGANFVDKRLEGKKRYRILAKAEDADILIFTREDFREFPDIWGSDSGLNLPKRLSNENPQLGEFALGEPKLIDWTSTDGAPHQGVLFLPGNYEEGKRYPVLVYFYRLFSQRMYQFNEMVINHRPNFPLYTSNGYAVFLPDVHFDVGTPGASASKSIVPGVQKVIDMGIGDPNAIGLHGHSWSGYQAAFMITETHIFKAAVAGAPVSNMTSAYSGIRLGSGLARQFQYEAGQSRIGASMWERRDLYIENSPVFFADRIQTPLLIQFGDIDEAVPWQQGIELYLAMRRLDKDVIFLQYHDEPHHLKKYPNKLDYTLKMKAFFDHHLKGEPAPAWMTEGVPYRGD